MTYKLVNPNRRDKFSYSVGSLVKIVGTKQYARIEKILPPPNNRIHVRILGQDKIQAMYPIALGLQFVETLPQ